ncbi:MAG: TolC family protein [Polaribacter sp.]|uniref:TolC family protein n=1 Tax=Polaribacter sp. TaxID=1920175 RepID=UPI003263DE0D
MHKNTFLICLIMLVFGFTKPIIAQQLDTELKDLIKKGLEKSHFINIYNLDKEQSKVDQKLAKAVFLPKITFGASFTRLDDDITFDDDTQNLLLSTQKLLIKEAIGIPFNDAFPTNIPLTEIPNLQDKNILKSYVDLDWVLFSGLKAYNALKASKHKEASLSYVTTVEKDKIALKIIETYDKLALVYASKKVLETSKKYLNEQEFFVKKAIKNGLAIPISRKKIELAQQQLIAKELEYNHNKSLLIELLHQLTGKSRTHLLMLHPKIQLFSTEKIDSKKRNEIKALEEAEKATLYKAKMENSNFIPKIALKGHYEFIDDDLSLFDPKWYVGIGVKWNAFDGLNSSLKSKKTKLEKKKYSEKIREANEMIALSIINAELTYKSALQNSKIIKKEIDLSLENYTLINKQYKNNLTTLNDVLDALNDLEKANFKLQQSYFKERRAYTNLLHARGVLKY